MRAHSTFRKHASFLWLGASLVGLYACGDEEPIPTPGFQIEEAPPERPSYHLEDDYFDADGNLRESDIVHVGLTMPRGLTVDREEERRHIYYSSVPIEKIVAYFGPRLFTGAVSRLGDGAIYRGARPVEVEENVVLLDVSILEAGSRARIEVHELPPIPDNPPGPAELQRRWDEMQRRLE